jgi:response regulator of citrate/malate metabolism
VLSGDRTLSQDEIDRGWRLLHDGDRPAAPKGQSAVTVRLVSDALRRAGAPRTAAEVADELGISRATAQRYLAALARDGTAEMRLRYGATGRPEHRYHWLASGSHAELAIITELRERSQPRAGSGKNLSIDIKLCFP